MCSGIHINSHATHFIHHFRLSQARAVASTDLHTVKHRLFFLQPCKWSGLIQLFLQFYSSFVDLNSYFGFYTEMITQILAARVQVTASITSIAFHLGMCMYLRGIVQALHRKLIQINDELHKTPKNFTAISMQLFRQIDFHEEILTLVEISSTFHWKNTLDVFPFSD